MLFFAYNDRTYLIIYTIHVRGSTATKILAKIAVT